MTKVAQNKRLRRTITITAGGVLALGLLSWPCIAWQSAPGPWVSGGQADPTADSEPGQVAADQSETPPPPSPQTPAPPAEEPAPKPLHRLATDQPDLVLTFDDGPTDLTRSFLKVLKENDVHATFFWLPKAGRMEAGPDLVAAGHQLGTHSRSHAQMTKLNPADQQAELAQSQSALEQASGAPVAFFRPPYGAYDATTLKSAARCGLTTVLWDVDPRDWQNGRTPEQIVAEVMRQVKPGSIILMHERPQTLAALPTLIQRLRAAGYRFRPLPSAHS